VTQYTTQALLPQIARCIDDIVYENYTVPVQVNEFKLLASDFPSALNDYDASAFVLKDALTLDEVERLQIINAICAQYINASTLRLSDMHRALTVAQYDAFVAALKTQEHQSEILYGAGVPAELKTYTPMLRAADFMTYKFEAMPLQGTTKYKYGAAVKVEDKAISLYEDALGRLEEIFTAASGADLQQLHDWMDRPIDFGTNGTLSTNIHAMPRVRGIKSAYAEDAGLPKLHKRLKRNECALKSLLVAGCEIAFVFPEEQVDPAVAAAQSHTLKQMMGKLRNAKD
jgi:hypothetical protein